MANTGKKLLTMAKNDQNDLKWIKMPTNDQKQVKFAKTC